MVKVLEISNLNYHNFKNINISFEKGMFYMVVGGNNSGKTTLFKLMSGLIPSNNIICDGISIDNINDYIKKIGVVERVNNKSFIYQKVYNELSFPLYNLGYSKRRRDNRINELLNSFNLDCIDKDINELNTKERQLLLIVLALLHKPKVLLLDSVLNVFSNEEQKEIVRVLKEYIEQDNLTVISFTKDLDEFSDKLVLLSNFKIIGEYTKEDIYKDDKLFYQNGLEIPFITDLAIKLKMYNVIDKNYNDLKEMVNDIWP